MFACLKQKFRERALARTMHAPPSATDLSNVRSAMRQSTQDCDGIPAQRLKVRINHANSLNDLWALRSDIYGLIARNHCQTEADSRINALDHLFKGGTCGHAHHTRCPHHDASHGLL